MNEDNRMRLLWAGFMAILAAGVGFAIRGGIFDNWQAEYGFTGAQLGAIGGAGFTGFCFGIIIGGFVVDKIGYGKLVLVAFVLHVLSAIVTFVPGAETSPAMAYTYLFWAMFIFAGANGVLEAVANPLVARLFPENRTHYLNILHASWPAGLVLGGMCGWYLDDQLGWGWKEQLALYLIPTLAYGFMFFGQKYPKSEASEKGLGLGEMFKDVGVLGALVVCYLLVQFFNGSLGFDLASSYCLGVVLLVVAGMVTRQQTEVSSQTLGLLAICILLGGYFQMAFDLPVLGSVIIGGVLLAGLGVSMKWAVGSFLLFVLFITHAMVGAVELGTDGWIQNITGNILTSEQGKILFVFTSLMMFTLRFCADFIEKKLGLSPIGILLTSSILACIGLNMASNISTFQSALIALAIYGIGKTFFWPTMLAVASDRYPRTGAVAISIMGGIGMLSAGIVGGPGLGYAKDRFSGEALQASDAENNSTVYETAKADSKSTFLFFAESTGIDGKQIGAIQGKLGTARAILEEGKVKDFDESSLEGKTEEEKEKARKGFSGKKEIEQALVSAEALTIGTPGKPEDATKILSAEESAIHAASIEGDRRTLRADSFIPGTMAVIYFFIFLYFRSQGGYKTVKIDD
jgi:MFS family permease